MFPEIRFFFSFKNISKLVTRRIVELHGIKQLLYTQVSALAGARAADARTRARRIGRRDVSNCEQEGDVRLSGACRRVDLFG